LKGLKVERATPGNVIDYYALLKEAAKEDALVHPRLSVEDVRQCYFGLVDELSDPSKIILLARKGRMFAGYFSSTIIRRDKYLAVINQIYVIPKRRKLGVGIKLWQAFDDQMKANGISRYEFLCKDEDVDYVKKKWKADKTLNFMVVDNG